MKKFIVPLILSCIFFTFFIQQVQFAFDRAAPQMLYLSIINFGSIVYIFYKFSLKDIAIYIKENKSFLYYSIFIFISGVSIIVSENKIESIVIYSQYITYFITFFVVLVIIKSHKFNFKDFFLKILMISVAVETFAVLYNVIDFVIINGNPFYRSNDFRGLSGNINITAFSIVAKAPVILYFMLSKQSKLILSICYVLFFMVCSSLFFLLTRGAFLAFVLIIGFVFMYKLIKDFKRSLLKILICIGVFILSFQTTTVIMDSNESNLIVDRVSSVKLDNTDESINQRLRYYSHSIKMISKSPLIGIGIGNWKLKSIEYDSQYMLEYIVPYYAHNDFLHIGAEIGILGMLFYIFFMISPLIIILKKIYSSKETFFEVTLLAILFVCIIDSSLNFPIGRPISHILLIFLIVLFNETNINLKAKKIA